MGEKSAAASASILKTNDVMNKIKTPGTPENKRFEDVFSAMPEVEAYNRQQKRVDDANEDVAYAEKDLRELLDGSPAVGFLPKSVVSRSAIDDLLGDRDENRRT